MKKLTRTLSVAQACVTMLSLVLISMPVSAFAAPKVEICHNGHILSVSTNGLNGHTTDRHPTDFLITTPELRASCTSNTEEVTPGVLRVVKKIRHNEDAHPQDFSFTVNGGTAIHFNSNGINDIPKTPGTYSVAEVANGNYTTTYSSTDPDHPTDCNSLTISEEEDVTCTITNDYNNGDSEVPTMCKVVSDITVQATNSAGTHPAAALSFIHPAWTPGTTGIPGATWIWGEDPIATPAVTTTETFTKTFYLASAGTGASLIVAADNSFTAVVNGHTEGSDTGGGTFAAPLTLTVPAQEPDSIQMCAHQPGSGYMPTPQRTTDKYLRSVFW